MPKQRKRGDSMTSAASCPPKGTTTSTGQTWQRVGIKFSSAITADAKRAVRGMAKIGAKCITGSIVVEGGLMTFQIWSGRAGSATGSTTSGRCGRPSKREGLSRRQAGWRRQLKRDLEDR